jgi:hypothetical protein
MIYTYDPTQVHFIFNGHVATGFAPGTFIKVTYNKPMWTTSVGTDGKGTRSKSSDLSAKVELTLTQASDSNQIYSAFTHTDRVANAGAGPLLIKDANGNGENIHMAETAWITKTPDVEYAQESTNRVWQFETDILIANVGN